MAHILVIDDETNIRTMVRLALQHIGHTVETAADGLEGLEKFASDGKYDLVLLDQRMPGIEGLDVLRQIRHTDRQTHVIMATAFGTIDLAVEAMKLGATDFLRKPFTAETLRGAVHVALNEPLPSGESPASKSSGVTFSSTTINGFRIEFLVGSGKRTSEGFVQPFTMRSPTGSIGACHVTLPVYIMELVKAHTDREHIPGGDRFWQSLCEEAIANHLWQNAEFPEGGELRIEELSGGLRRFVDAVLAV